MVIWHMSGIWHMGFTVASDPKTVFIQWYLPQYISSQETNTSYENPDHERVLLKESGFVKILKVSEIVE